MVRIYHLTRPPQSRLACSIIIYALFSPFSLHSPDHFTDHSEDHTEDQPKKGKKIPRSSKTICENASFAPGPVMLSGEQDSVSAAAHLASCLQLSGLAACKTLGAHACIQVFRRRPGCAHFFERASRASLALGAKDAGAGSERGKGEPGRAGHWNRKRPSGAGAFVL